MAKKMIFSFLKNIFCLLLVPRYSQTCMFIQIAIKSKLMTKKSLSWSLPNEVFTVK